MSALRTGHEKTLNSLLNSFDIKKSCMVIINYESALLFVDLWWGGYLGGRRRHKFLFVRRQ